MQNDNGEMLAILHKGGFFGELALLATARRTAQCVALCHCDLTLLMAQDLVTAMKDFPDSAEKVRQWRGGRVSHGGGQLIAVLSCRTPSAVIEASGFH